MYQLDWQLAAAIAVVLLASVALLRRVAKTLRSPAQANCGASCSDCSTAGSKKSGELIQIGSRVIEPTPMNTTDIA